MEKEARIAKLGIAEELRNMEVGDIVQFPVTKYNYNSIRSSPTTSLIVEKLEGRRWRTRMDYDTGNAIVTRIA